VDTAPKAKRRRGRWFPWLIALLLAAFIGGLFAAPYAEQQLRIWNLLPANPAQPDKTAQVATGTDDVIAGIEERLGRLDSRLGALEAAVSQVSEESAATTRRLEDLTRSLASIRTSGGDDSAQTFNQIESRLTVLAERISELETAQAQSAAAVTPAEVTNLAKALEAAGTQRERLAAQIETLTRRMATLEALSRAAPPYAPDLLKSLLDLAGRLEAGRPYEAPLADVKREVASLPDASQVGATAAFTALEPYASVGLPTRSSLLSRYGEIAAAIQRAEPPPGEAGIFERLKRRLASIVVVRPKSAPAGETGLGVRLARVEALLEAGDLAGTIAALTTLRPATRAPAEDWLADARARLEAERALRALLAIAGTDLGETEDSS